MRFDETSQTILLYSHRSLRIPPFSNPSRNKGKANPILGPIKLAGSFRNCLSPQSGDQGPPVPEDAAGGCNLPEGGHHRQPGPQSPLSLEVFMGSLEGQNKMDPCWVMSVTKAAVPELSGHRAGHPVRSHPLSALCGKQKHSDPALSAGPHLQISFRQKPRLLLEKFPAEHQKFQHKQPPVQRITVSGLRITPQQLVRNTAASFLLERSQLWGLRL